MQLNNPKKKKNNKDQFHNKTKKAKLILRNER